MSCWTTPGCWSVPPVLRPDRGRPSIPIETYLRLMFLKYRYALGYERLCTLVGDSLSWRRFCRIGLEVSVPDESTIRKITRRCGPELVDALNRQLLAVAGEHGDTDLGRVRADTTVVEADIKYPTDSGLLTAATCRIAVRMRRLTNVGVRVSYTAASPPAPISMRSGRGYDAARTKPRPRCWRSPVSSLISPKRPSPKPASPYDTRPAVVTFAGCSTISPSSSSAPTRSSIRPAPA